MLRYVFIVEFSVSTWVHFIYLDLVFINLSLQLVLIYHHPAKETKTANATGQTEGISEKSLARLVYYYKYYCCYARS